MCNSTFAQAQNDQSTFTLNLKNTDIQSLIATVSKQTGRNFVVDPRVKAKVTVISNEPVDADGLYEVFLSVLQVHGYSAVPAGDLIKIVPDVTAKQGPVPILGEDPDTSDQLVTQVVTVVNVPAAQLVPILRPMVPQQGHLAAYAATNSLIITDRASNIQRLMEIIRRIDRPDNEEIEVVRLNHASATEIVRTLGSLQRNNIGGPQGPGAMQLVADERTNSVLISGDTAVRIRVRGLIAHLDTPIESGGNTRVVYLKFANAEDMVTILQGVSQGQAAVGATTTDASGAQPTFTTPQQPTAQQQGANNTIVRNNTQTNAVTPRSAAETGESSVDIQADPNTNALIITAPPDEMQNILAVIRQLDIRRAQVLVEAVIAEITEDNTREFGINFLLDGSDNDAPIGFTNLGGATDGALGIAGSIATTGVPSSLGAGLSLALGRFASGEIDFGFLVRAIASDADNNILSTPSIVTLDNEEAEIVVGANVPFVTGQQLSTNNDNPFQTIERRDVGLTLKVKPQINDGNTIKMELEQEVSSVSPTALTGASDITTSTRQLKTTVLVDDGQTLVLGGLIDDQISDVIEKVPLLGDIPFLGRLFRFNSTTKTKQNLMIFLHPVILRDADTASDFSNSKYNSLRSRQLLYQQQKDESVTKDPQELPEIKLYFDGKSVDGPLTQYESPGFESPSEPLQLTDLSKGTIVKAGGGAPIAAASPAKTDIDKVVAAYNAEKAEQILEEYQPEPELAALLNAEQANAEKAKAELIVAEEQKLAILKAEEQKAAAQTTANVKVFKAPTPVEINEDPAPELPVANPALIADILQTEPDVQTETAVVETKDNQQEPTPVLVSFEENFTKDSSVDTPDESEIVAESEATVDKDPIPSLSLETVSEETPQAAVKSKGTIVKTNGGTLIMGSSPVQVSSGETTDEIISDDSSVETVAIATESDNSEENVIVAESAIAAESDAIVNVEDDPILSLPLATVFPEPAEEPKGTIVKTNGGTIIMGSSPVQVSSDEIISDDSSAETVAAATDSDNAVENVILAEATIAAENEANIDVEDDPLLSLPLATVLPEAAVAIPAIEEVPASSKSIASDTAADSIIEAEDTDAVAEVFSAETDAVTLGEYVDNIDSEIVDRSQDDLADDRPEVFWISVTSGDNAQLPEMQSAPRY